MARKGIGASIPTLLVIMVGIIFIVVIWRNKNFLRFGSPITATAAIGATVPGPNVYPVVGQITPTQGTTGLSEATGGDGEPSYRDSIGFDCSKCNRETTWFVVPGNPGEGGMDFSIKMGSHGGGNDNGSLIAFSQVPLGGSGGSWACEGPYGTNGDISGGSGSLSLPTTSKIGVKGISWNVGGDTEHHKIWFNADGTGAEWTMVAQFQGASSCNPLSCPIPSGEGCASCQDTLRIDGPDGHQFISRSIVEITPTDNPVGGGTALTSIPTRDRDAGGGDTTTEEEEDEDEEDEDEDEDDEDDDNNNGGDGDSPGTRSQDSTTQRINSCSGLTGETYRSCVNGAAARSTRRRGNIARRGPLTRAMISAYSPNYFKLRKKIRVGNVR